MIRAIFKLIAAQRMILAILSEMDDGKFSTPISLSHKYLNEASNNLNECLDKLKDLAITIEKAKYEKPGSKD